MQYNTSDLQQDIHIIKYTDFQVNLHEHSHFDIQTCPVVTGDKLIISKVCYISQTVICVVIFSMALFGQVGPLLNHILHVLLTL